MTRRRFGAIRELPSGRWQARVLDPNTGKLAAIGVFLSKTDAAVALSLAEADQRRGGWVNPQRGRVTLGDYAETWLASRPLAPKTLEIYRNLLGRSERPGAPAKGHILPVLGDVELGKLSPGLVRAWQASLVVGEDGPGRVTAAKAYRLLASICATAVADEVIVKSPCALKGAGVERSPERPTATVAEVYALADAVGERFRALVLVAAFCSLRRGEAFALVRRDVDLLHKRLRIERAHVELADGRILVGAPKTEASRRSVAIPDVIIPDLEEHLARWAAPGEEGLLFIGVKGGPLRPHVWGKVWRAARTKVGVPSLHFHDLRGTGATLAAAAGASMKDLMARLGHRSTRAALLYQHASEDRDTALARALSDLVSSAPRADEVRPVAVLRPGETS